MLEDYFKSFGENPAKAKIVFKAIYRENANSFLNINNLSEPIKAKLEADFDFTKIELVTKSESVDTCKYLFKRKQA